MTKSRRSSTIQISSGRMRVAALRRHETNIPGVATGVRFPVSSMRETGDRSSLAFGFADRPGGFCVPRRAGRPAADPETQPTAIQFSFDRPINASAAPFVLAAADGLFGFGRPRGHHQYRQRIAGRDRARRRRRQRFRAGRHQRADPLSRPVGCAARQGGVRAVQQVALRHHCPQEPGHPRAVRYRRQNARRRRRRSVDPAVAGAGAAKRHQDRKRQAGTHSAPRCASRCCRQVRSMP